MPVLICGFTVPFICLWKHVKKSIYLVVFILSHSQVGFMWIMYLVLITCTCWTDTMLMMNQRTTWRYWHLPIISASVFILPPLSPSRNRMYIHTHTHTHTPYTYYMHMLDKNHAQKAPLMLACFSAHTSAAGNGDSRAAGNGDSRAVSSSSNCWSIGGSLRSAGDEWQVEENNTERLFFLLPQTEGMTSLWVARKVRWMDAAACDNPP